MGPVTGQMQVRDIMTKEVVTIQYSDPITKAADKMLRSKIHGLVVLREGQAVGVISTFDLLKIVFMEKYKDSVKVETFISSQNLIVIDPFKTIDEAAKIMVGNNIRTLPVVENGKLTGIVSMMDIMKQVVS